jgi:transposase
MYNAALYNIRQDYINNKGVLKYETNYHRCKGSDAYKSMNSVTAQETMKLASEAMSSYLELRKLFVKGELDFRPSLSKHLNKHDFQVIRHTQRAFVVKGNQVVLSIPGNLKAMYPDHQDLMSFEIPSQLLPVKDAIKQVHIVPCYDAQYFKISFVYEPKQQMADLDPAKYLSIDLGVNNFATCIDSNGNAVIIDGKYAKSLNQYYNKENARLQSIKDKQNIRPVTARQSRMIRKRENRMREFLNVTTKRLVTIAWKMASVTLSSVN